MKATKDVERQNEKKRSWRHAAASAPGETAMCVALGLVGLLAILLAVASGSVPGVKSEPSTAAQKALAAVQKAPVVRYVSSGQLIADARTAEALVLYLL